MKLFAGKIPFIATEIVRVLTSEGDIEVDSIQEVELDVSAVLKEYLRMEREISERAKDILQHRGLSYSQFGRIRKLVAEEKGFGIEDEAIDYIIEQLIACFMHSIHVEEVYSEDNVLRKKMGQILRRHMTVDEELEEEVKKKIKHLEEGTRIWEIEYKKVMEELKKKKRL
jgi:hypothetical protein